MSKVFKRTYFFFLVALQLSTAFNLLSQTLPKDSSDINYTQVLFEFPNVKNANYYLLQIAERQNTSSLKEYKCQTNAYFIDNLKFGKIYRWRAIAFDKKHNKIDSTNYFAFRTKGVDLVNTNFARMRLNKQDSSIKGNDLIFIDYPRIAIDRVGNPIWYLPDIENKVNATQRIRDLKMTYDGNITFLTNQSAIECDINGNVIWEAPELMGSKTDSMGFYHHGFKKLDNGNYIVIGSKYVYKAFPDTIKSNPLKKYNVFKTIDGVNHIRVEYGLVYEFSKSKEIVWQWDSEDYLSLNDLFHHGNADTISIVGAHLNSLDVNRENTEVLIGFRDLSRVIVVDKKTKTITESYGSKTFSDSKVHQFKGFQFQHDARFLGDSSITLFNNNAIYCNTNLTSAVMVFKRSKYRSSTTLDLNFSCAFDSLADGRSLKGGSIQSLQNGNFLVCMGHLNRIFEVTKGGKVVWDGFYEKYLAAEKKWTAFPQYRVSSASSLYPICFSFKCKAVGKKKLELTIVNNGSEKDSYMVYVKAKANTILQEFKTDDVVAGENFVKEINLKCKSKNLIIEVVSKTNSLSVKRMTIE